MRKIILTAGVLLGIMALTGCDNSSHGLDYRVTCVIDNKVSHDSATLLVLEDAYGQLRMCGTARGDNGTFTFTGQTDQPKVALIRWDNDSTEPFYFVLEQGDTRITIKPDSWHITGSPQNSEYLHYINQQEYLKMAADSSLRRDDEVRMVRQDSLLNDSLQRITVERINRGDAVSRIIKERYGKLLDQEHMRMLK